MAGDCCCCAKEAEAPSSSLEQHSADNSSSSSAQGVARWATWHLPSEAVDPLCQASLSSPGTAVLASAAAAAVVNLGSLSTLLASAASSPTAAPWLFAAQVLLFQTCHLLRRNQDLSDAYWGERRGRARVEREMRRIADVQLTTSDGFFVQPVGVVRSCYKQCIGTPRQGLLAPSSRASIVFVKSISPAALDDLDGFSHVWITFKFHLNTNTLKEAKAFGSGTRGAGKTGTEEGEEKRGAQRFTFTAKITPPMLKRKVGVFSTRSPHRPNPIGVTLARIERVDTAARTVHLSACDLVHGTPVLDIKPYVPFYDSIDQADGNCRVPAWIEETIASRVSVLVSDAAAEAARAILLPPPSASAFASTAGRSRRKASGYSGFYTNDESAFWRAVKETLAADVRSSFQTRRGAPVALPPALLGRTGKAPVSSDVAGALDVEDVAEGEELKLPFDEVVLHYKWVAAPASASSQQSQSEVDAGLPVVLNANGGVGHIEVTNVTLPDPEDVSRVHGVSRRELVVERLPPSLLEEVGGRFEGGGEAEQAEDDGVGQQPAQGR